MGREEKVASALGLDNGLLLASVVWLSSPFIHCLKAKFKTQRAYSLSSLVDVGVDHRQEEGYDP